MPKSGKRTTTPRRTMLRALDEIAAYSDEIADYAADVANSNREIANALATFFINTGRIAAAFERLCTILDQATFIDDTGGEVTRNIRVERFD